MAASTGGIGSPSCAAPILLPGGGILFRVGARYPTPHQAGCRSLLFGWCQDTYTIPIFRHLSAFFVLGEIVENALFSSVCRTFSLFAASLRSDGPFNILVQLPLTVTRCRHTVDRDADRYCEGMKDEG
jgi:hypothetical protein